MVTALGPGMTVTGTSAPMAARTRAAPGSLTDGMPASVTSATLSPATSRSTSPAIRFSDRVRVERDEALAVDVEVR